MCTVATRGWFTGNASMTSRSLKASVSLLLTKQGKMLWVSSHLDVTVIYARVFSFYFLHDLLREDVYLSASDTKQDWCDV